LAAQTCEGDALNSPSAVDEPGSLVDLSSDFVHAGTTLKSHYNINFTLFEASGPAWDDDCLNTRNKRIMMWSQLQRA